METCTQDSQYLSDAFTTNKGINHQKILEYLEKILKSNNIDTDVIIASIFHEIFKDHFISSSWNEKNNIKNCTWFQFKKINFDIEWNISNILPICEEIILHRWVNICDIEIHKYIDYYLTHFFMNQARSYQNKLSNYSNNTQYYERDDLYDIKIRSLQRKVDRLYKVINKLCSSSKKKCIIRQLKILFFVPKQNFIDKLDEKKNLICFENGVYDLDKMEFRDGKHDDMISISTKYEFTSQPNEKIQREILYFYGSIFDDPNIMEYKLNVNAYHLHGKKDLNKFWIWIGDARNGKSAEWRLLSTTFGEYCYNADSIILTKKKSNSSKLDPSIARIKGKRIIISSAPYIRDKIISSKLKEFINVDSKVKIRGVNEFGSEFNQQAGINIICNSMPLFTTNDPVGREQMKIIKYPYEFTTDPISPNEKEMDMNLKTKFSNIEYGQQNMLLLIDRFKKVVHNKKLLFSS